MMPADSSYDSSAVVDRALKTLLLLDLVDSTALVESQGDYRAAQIFARCDATARELLAEHNGTEIDKADGFLLMFDRPFDAVAYALAFHEALDRLSRESNVKLCARGGIHLGEVVLRRNPPEHVARGAKPLEVEGLAKPLAARIMSLAQGAQTLMTRAAFDLARRAAEGEPGIGRRIDWLNHGVYRFKGIDETQVVCEVGVEGLSPLSAPPSSEKAWRVTAQPEEELTGWWPSWGQGIPGHYGWILERELGENSLGKLWLCRTKANDPHAETLDYDANPDEPKELQERAMLFCRADGAGEGTDQPKCWMVSGCVSCIVVASEHQRGTFVLLTRKRFSCGRGATVDLQVNDPKVSREHFEIQPAEAGYRIFELRSRNGVFVNGERISGEQDLESGDKITIGDTDLVFYQA